MEAPLVSIIMGAYNCESSIFTSINSIMNQSYQNWEFIICDDCSTDNTRKILEEFQEMDKRICVLHNDKNLKLAATLNKCLEKAKGKYIARMDADDESLPQRLEKQVGFLETHPEYDCVGCNCIVFDEQGARGIRRTAEFPSEGVLLKGTPFAHPTIVMKKKVYDALRGYTSNRETVRAEDLELWFRFYENHYRGYNLQQALYKYHESREDFRKRSLTAGIQTAKVFWRGYKRINVPFYKRIWVFKPIVSALIPNWLMMKYQSGKLMDD